MRDHIDTFVARLTPVHRPALVVKSQKVSDDEPAVLAGISRPTLIKRRRTIYQRVEAVLIEGLPDSLHNEAMRELLHACSELEEADE